MRQWKLRLTVFLCGASVMIVELVGSRLLAPFLGSSLIVWTTIIGVILAALSFGYWLGGRLADREATSFRFALIILASAFSSAAIIILSLGLGPVSRFGINLGGVMFSSIISSLYLFLVPSILLGMVSPYALKLSLSALEKTGRTAGNLYALSTIGSIVGTFAAGFFFIPTLGSFKTLFAVSIILLICGLLYICKWPVLLVLACIAYSGTLSIVYPATLFPYVSVEAEWESGYNRLFLAKRIDAETQREILSLMSGPRVAQSARFADNDPELVFAYTKFFRNIEIFKPDVERALMIGGGAYSVPKDFLSRNPNATMDVVEIDPLYTKIAREHFNLQEDTRLNIYHEDGRLFLQDDHGTYDAIFIDAFNNSGSVPFHLATREAVQLVSDKLSDSGVVIVNLIGSIDGAGKDFIRSEFETYQKIFSHVELIPLGNFSENVQNIMLVASHTNISPLLNLEPLSGFETNARVLTDDWAPVDYFLSGIL